LSRQLDNWLEHYMKFTQNSEPPPLYHLWSGIVAIASCMQRKCWMSWGHEMTIYPNLYVVLVGPPGGRKGTAMKIAKSLVRKVDVALGSDSLGSIQALYKEIHDSHEEFIHPEEQLPVGHKSLSVWSEEFQVFLSDSDPRLIGNLTDLFDSPDSWRYSAITRGVSDLSNCWLTVFGAITPTLLQSKLNQDAVGGGLISRIVFVVGYGKSKKVPMTFLSKEEYELFDTLLEDLQYIKNLAGPFSMSPKFIETYSTWYMGASSSQGVDSEKFVGYNERRALHIRKLCMIMAVSENNDRYLQERHFLRALHVLEMTENEMPNAFYGLGSGAHSAVLTNIITYIKSRGQVEHSELTKRFQLDTLTNGLGELLETLIQGGTIRQELTPSKKRILTYNDVSLKEDKNYFDNELFKHLE